MKPPAFQFYADDFLAGTICLTAEDCGAYIRLLCYQWGNGSIPSKKEMVDRIAGCDVSVDVLSKFPNGRNKRLEAERCKQNAYRKMQSEKAKRSAQARLRVGSGSAEGRVAPEGSSPNSDLHTPSLNTKSRCFAPPTLLEVEAYAVEIQLSKSKCPEFMDYYESNGWMVGKNKMKSWKATLRRWKNNSYGTNGVSSKPLVDRNAGTANEGKSSQYAGVGKVVQIQPGLGFTHNPPAALPNGH